MPGTRHESAAAAELLKCIEPARFTQRAGLYLLTFRRDLQFHDLVVGRRRYGLWVLGESEGGEQGGKHHVPHNKDQADAGLTGPRARVSEPVLLGSEHQEKRT